MADGVAITAGSGTNIATDDVTVNGVAGHVQYVKLVDGSANGTDGIPGTTQGLGIVNRRDLQRIAVNSGGLTIAHDFSCASIESRSLSFGTIRSCSWKKRCSTSGYREASVTLLTMRVCASMARMDACEEPAEDGWDAWDRDGWDRGGWDRDAWDRDAWEGDL